jgi:hypothetical protein
MNNPLKIVPIAITLVLISCQAQKPNTNDWTSLPANSYGNTWHSTQVTQISEEVKAIWMRKDEANIIHQIYVHCTQHKIALKSTWNYSSDIWETQKENTDNALMWAEDKVIPQTICH